MISALLTHTGEEWFQLQWPQYAMLGVLLLSYLLLALKNRLPRMAAFKEFLDAVNSAGGHIFILTLLTAWSIKIAMQFFYHLLSLDTETVSKADALVTAGVTFVTGTLAGTFIGALLKTMSGGRANGQPTPDKLDVNFVPAPSPGVVPAQPTKEENP